MPHGRYWRSIDISTLKSLEWYIQQIIEQIQINEKTFHYNYNIGILGSVSHETFKLAECLNKKKFENLRKSMTVPNQPIFVWDGWCKKSTWNYNALHPWKF